MEAEGQLLVLRRCKCEPWFWDPADLLPCLKGNCNHFYRVPSRIHFGLDRKSRLPADLEDSLVKRVAFGCILEGILLYDATWNLEAACPMTASLSGKVLISQPTEFNHEPRLHSNWYCAFYMSDPEKRSILEIFQLCFEGLESCRFLQRSRYSNWWGSTA